MMESNESETEGMREEEINLKPILPTRRRNTIQKKEESLGKGFKRAMLDIDESKVSVAPEESWFIGECFPGRYLFCWFFPYVFKGIFKSTTMQDLPKVPIHSECEYMEKNFDFIWPKLKGVPLRLLLTMNYCFGIEFWIAGIIQLVTTCCQVFVPKLMQLFLEQLFKPYDEDVPEVIENMDKLRQILPSSHEIYPPPNDDIVRTNNWEAWMYLGLLVVCYWFGSWGLQYSFHISARVGMKVRTIVVSKVYQKSLRLSNKARGKYENGVIMNHVTTDAVKFERVHMMMHYGWTGWVMLLGCLPFLIDLIDWGALYGILTNLLIIPVCVFVISIFIVFRIMIVKITDSRVNKTNEVLQSIRIVKFFAWEDSFLKRILKIRFREIALLRVTFSLFSVLISVFLTLTNIVCFVAFLTFFLNHGYLDSIKVFTALTYFNTMRAPLMIAPMTLIMVLEMVVSFTRIRLLLEEEELEETEVSENEEYPVLIEGGTFRWEVSKKKGGGVVRSRREIQKERMTKLVKKVCCCVCAPLCAKGDGISSYALPPVNYDENDDEVGEAKSDGADNSNSNIGNKVSQLLFPICNKLKKKKKKKKKKPKLVVPDDGKKEEEQEEKEGVNLGYLEDINLRIKKGKLVMVIGRVGSGKSSLLYAILGEMKRYEGSVRTSKNFALASQLPWIQNASLFQNVVFGEEENEEKWEEIVQCCQLQQDLEELKGGRNIEIGEKGINLSGGQKYRVQLARACYSVRDVVLLDDPLAAVDAHVGKKIFFECILGYLKERTRVLVTHQLQYLEHADWVVLMDEGKIREQGRYSDLMEKKGAVADLISDYNASLEEEEEEEEEVIEVIEIIDEEKKMEEEEEEEEGGEILFSVEQQAEEESEQEEEDKGEDLLEERIRRSKLESKLNISGRKKKEENRRKQKSNKTSSQQQQLQQQQQRKDEDQEVNKIIQLEEMSSGIISPRVVLTYIYNMRCCCGIIPVIIIFIVFLAAQLVFVGTDWWLSEWSNGRFNEEFSNDFHMYVYVKGFGSDGAPMLSYLDYDEYSKNVPPVIDTNLSSIVFGNNSNTAFYTPIINGYVNCSIFKSNQQQQQDTDDKAQNPFVSSLEIVKKVPTDYRCPSPIGWCGCNDFYLPVKWIRGWDNGTKIDDGLKQEESLYIYAGFGFSSLIFMFIRTIISLNFLVTAAHSLHNKALKRVLRAPMSFFDTTPIGRIVARFSTDTTLLDSELITSVMPAMSMGFAVGGMFFIICYNTDGLGAIFVVPLGFVYFVLYIFYRKTNMELKRLESVSKTPMLSHISETLNGMPTIRAYQVKPRFIDRVRKLINHNNRSYYMLTSAQRWLGVYLGMFGSLFMFSVGMFLIVIYFYWDFVEIDISYTALALSYSILATQMFFMVVDNVCEAEVKMNSVERINYYCQNIPIESPFETGRRKPKNFVKKGTIEFRNYSMRYRPGLELVLKNLNFKIRPFERIGIVGRTGSGKSSMMIALWRIVEAARGKILLDGHHIEELNLLQLRNSLSIIPQDATLFSGTVRSNLDPFNEFKDKELWKALRQSYMFDKVMSLKGKLSGVMKEGGSNFSVGERQLFCLGRALLRNTKILVLDEATASVDVATDSKIQKTIRESFKSCTSLTIAHRLETIIDCDRILVMDDGYAVEFDTPRNLLEETEKYSIFRDLVRETGEGTEDFLYDVAFGRVDYDKQISVEVKEDDEVVVDDDDDEEDEESSEDDNDSGISGDTEEEDDDDDD